MLNILTPPQTILPSSSSLPPNSPTLRASHYHSRSAAYGQYNPQEEDRRFQGRSGCMGPAPGTLAGHGPVINNRGLHGNQLSSSDRLAIQRSSGIYAVKPRPAVASARTLHSEPLLTQPPPAVPYQPSSPVKAPVFEALGAENETLDSSSQIVSYLQIPPEINSSKGSLSDFAAQITCLFWFESSSALQRVEKSSSTPTPVLPLEDEATPSMGFRKWVTTMLSTTQVTQNVILLALLFIYRLKKQNPQVKGRLGSEYRLLTVALMLGNKFLDDNTYTNKTWADVSGIAVAEIHVMEVEFLSNMRYNLYTSAEEWQTWYRKLGRFWDYFEEATRVVEQQILKLRGQRTLAPPLAIPSPPQSQHTSPSFSTHDTIPSTTVFTPAYFGPTAATPFARLPEFDLRPGSRKRSYDDAAASAEEPQAKRVLRSNSGQAHPMHSRVPSDSSNISTSSPHALPRLPLPIYQQTPFSQVMMAGTPASQLPPPQTRAMGMVFGNGVPMANGLGGPPMSYQNANTALARLQIPPIYGGSSQHGTPHHSTPRGVTPSGMTTAGSATGSPTNLALTPNTNTELLSPAGFTIQRSSPYRPVRAVNTLLVPPPAGSFQNPPQHIGAGNMHYQPLGRPLSERRVGVVPFVHSDQIGWAHLTPFR